MTDKAAALTCLVNTPAAAEKAEVALKQFEEQYSNEALVMNLWLQIQAANAQPGGLSRVQALLQHPSIYHV